MCRVASSSPSTGDEEPGYSATRLVRLITRTLAAMLLAERQT